jgi:hypothetical protein
VQLETVRLNGACALDLIQSLIAAVNKLGDDVTQLKSDNAALKTQVQDLQGLMAEHIIFPGSSHRGHRPSGLLFTRKSLNRAM